MGERYLGRAWVAAALAVSAIALPTPAIAADPVPVESARTTYRSARARVETLRAGQSSLEQRITALKKAGAQPQVLDGLLKRSVAAETELEAARADLRTSELRLAASLNTRVRQIDRQIRGLVPSLKRGPMKSRKAAAMQINALRATRQQLRTEAAALARHQARARVWAQYRVRFDARDGPSELAEKADFVEDTRDKVVRKRRALIRLLREARQERAIAEAAQDFRTDVTLFDEETRQGRVLRQAGRTTAADGDARSPAPVSGPGPEVEDSGSDQFVGGDAPPTTTPDPVAPGPLPARQIDPDVLLNLRVETLAAGALDVATLERYVADLKALERFLSGQADSLRERADSLEAIEARDPRK